MLCHCMEGRQDHRHAAADAIATVCDCGKTAFRFNERGYSVFAAVLLGELKSSICVRASAVFTFRRPVDSGPCFRFASPILGSFF
jgi:hypothetical protein